MCWFCFHEWIWEDKSTRVCSKCGKIQHLVIYGYCGQGDDGQEMWTSHKDYVRKLTHDEIYGGNSEEKKIKYRKEIEKVLLQSQFHVKEEKIK